MDGDYICSKGRMDNWEGSEPFVWDNAFNYSNLSIWTFSFIFQFFGDGVGGL